MKRICVLLSAIVDVAFSLAMAAATVFLVYAVISIADGASPLLGAFDGQYQLGDLTQGIMGGLLVIICVVVGAVALTTLFGAIVGGIMVAIDFKFVATGKFKNMEERDRLKGGAVIEGIIAVLAFFLAIVISRMKELQEVPELPVVIGLVCAVGGVALFASLAKLIAIYLEKKERAALPPVQPKTWDEGKYDG